MVVLEEDGGRALPTGGHTRDLIVNSDHEKQVMSLTFFLCFCLRISPENEMFIKIMYSENRTCGYFLFRTYLITLMHKNSWTNYLQDGNVRDKSWYNEKRIR